MKKALTLVIALALVILAGCAQKESVEYVQRLLPEPASIVVSLGSTDLTYGPDSEQYQKLVASLTPNWWKVMGDVGLTEPASVKELRTTSYQIYRQNDDTFVEFLYPNGIQWTQDDGGILTIRMISFLLPRTKDASEPVEGFFIISKSDGYLDTEGLYTYYYPAEMANGFWDYLLH